MSDEEAQELEQLEQAMYDAQHEAGLAEERYFSRRHELDPPKPFDRATASPLEIALHDMYRPALEQQLLGEPVGLVYHFGRVQVSDELL